MNDLFVTPQQAKELKELGFDDETFCFYLNDEFYYLWMDNEEAIKAPLYIQVVEWLIKKHRIFVEVEFDFITYDVTIKRPEKQHISFISSLSGITPYRIIEMRDAYSLGVDEAIKLIKKPQEEWDS